MIQNQTNNKKKSQKTMTIGKHPQLDKDHLPLYN